MKRTFADLHLLMDLQSRPNDSRIISKIATLGYDLVAVPLSSETDENATRTVRDLCNEANIDFASRVDLKPKTPNDLMRQLRKFRRKFEVICVICENKEVARQAAKDRRVDLLNFPSFDFRRRFFDRAEAELASHCLAALEIDVKPLLTLEGPMRIRLLSSLRRETFIAKEFHIPVVISSGANSGMLLRKPREQAALANLFDLGETNALEAVSLNPMQIVERNRQKLGSKFVAPGIKVIKEGKEP